MASFKFVLLASLAQICSAYYPVVIMHGIGADNSSVASVVNWIEAALPGTYVKNVEIGNGYDDSFFMHMSDQVASMCQQLAADPNLAGGFNMIGYSQGGLVTRGYVERCNNPPVRNFITWASPHLGEFGIPNADWGFLVEEFGDELYNEPLQSLFTFAQYWRDSYDLTRYLEKSTYLADLNNDRPVKNATYKNNILSLKNLVLLHSSTDTIVYPNTSGWFQGYANDSVTTVVPLNQSIWYIEDWLGLQTLDKSGRLTFFTTSCEHPDFPSQHCKPEVFDKMTLPWLKL